MPELGDEPDDWPTVEEIAAGCIQTMRTVQPDGPYCVGGYSFGGVIAFEIARQLETAGETISLLALLEPDPPRPFLTQGFAFNLSRLIFHGRKIAKFSFKKQMSYLSERIRRKMSFISPPGEAGNSDADLATYMLRTETIHERYHALPFSGQAILFLAKDTLWRVSPEKDPRLLWNNLTGEELEIHELPGDHTSVIREPNVREMAQHLEAYLEKSRRVDSNEPDVAAISR
jgi:thioesterase domain-containing protein